MPQDVVVNGQGPITLAVVAALVIFGMLTALARKG